MSRERAARWLVAAAIAALAAAGLWFTLSALVIPVKAVLAQILLERAWTETLAGKRQVRPWPGADTWPVARLRLPAHDADHIVLASASGQALAFGPGHVAGTAAPGNAGLSMIGGHRDTHLRVLARIGIGDRVELQRPDGALRTYRVTATSIADARLPWPAPADADGLVLVTCYPFDAILPGGPLRFLVHAVPVGHIDGSTRQLSTAHRL